MRTPSAASIGADVRVVLAEQIGKQARVVEMEFERVFGG